MIAVAHDVPAANASEAVAWPAFEVDGFVSDLT